MYTFNFTLRQELYIKELETKGVVTALTVVDSGTMYRVRYFYSGEPKETYFYDWELSEKKP
jgi:hypothetical protein